MIIGIGCDVVNMKRLEKSTDFLQRFMQKILGKNELDEAKKIQNTPELVRFAAKHFAAKEAFVKALGTGFRNGIYLQDIEVLHNVFGKPVLKIHNEALKILQKQADCVATHISLSDDYPYAQAVVILESL